MSALPRLFSCTRSLMEVPFAWAMLDRVSPALTVYWPGAATDVVVVVGVADAFSVSVLPAMMTFGSWIPFRLTRRSIETPVVLAIAERVSPGWIKYVLAPSRADANDCADRIATMTPIAAPASCSRQLRRGMKARARSPNDGVCRTRRRGRVRLDTTPR